MAHSLESQTSMLILGAPRPAFRVSGEAYAFLTCTLNDSDPRDVANQLCGRLEGSLALSPSCPGCVILGRLPDLSELSKMGKGLTPTLEPYQAKCLGTSPFLPVWGGPRGQAVLSVSPPCSPCTPALSLRRAQGICPVCVWMGRQHGPPSPRAA